ncbi:MAG: type II toxin-antitoxin system VapC family toxin [Chloroflexi bacterium]|nr:type II toxin-antitoxin system VapC family toxin [Chloroflexota bacterium]
MNHAIVLDASVVVKVIIEEEFSEQAETLLTANIRARRPLFGPPHLASEVTNAIYQRLRRRHITAIEAEQTLNHFLQLPIQLLAPVDLYEEAFLFARTNKLTNTYDSLYVALARILNAELWTDDRALINSVGSIAPWIRWIGNYPL